MLTSISTPDVLTISVPGARSFDEMANMSKDARRHLDEHYALDWGFVKRCPFVFLTLFLQEEEEEEETLPSIFVIAC